MFSSAFFAVVRLGYVAGDLVEEDFEVSQFGLAFVFSPPFVFRERLKNITGGKIHILSS